MENLDFLKVVTTVSSIVFPLITAVIAYLLYSKSRIQTKYDQIEKKVVLETHRSSLEKDLFELNKRLSATEERWKDINHLLLNRLNQEIPISTKETTTVVAVNNFLKTNGITDSDLQIEKNFVFVLTPFNDFYENDYKLIKNICTNVGLKCHRGDQEYLSGDIFSHMLKYIVKASLIVVNINGRNPNVFYELGIAQALDKPTIIISSSLSEVPFDIRSKRIIIYDSDLSLEKQLKSELLRLFIGTNILSNEPTLNSPIKIIKAKYGTEANSFDCTEEIRKLIVNNSLDFVITNELVGDPQPGNVKTLQIEYEVNGITNIRNYPEGAKVVIRV